MDEIVDEIIRIFSTSKIMESMPDEQLEYIDGLLLVQKIFEYNFEDSYKIKLKDFTFGRKLEILDANKIIIVIRFKTLWFNKNQHWKIYPDRAIINSSNNCSIIASELYDNKPIYINSRLTKEKHFNFLMSVPLASYENMKFIMKLKEKMTHKMSTQNFAIVFHDFDLEKLKKVRFENI